MWETLRKDEVITRLNTNAEHGLEEQEVKARIEK